MSSSRSDDASSISDDDAPGFLNLGSDSEDIELPSLKKPKKLISIKEARRSMIVSGKPLTTKKLKAGLDEAETLEVRQQIVSSTDISDHDKIEYLKSILSDALHDAYFETKSFIDPSYHSKRTTVNRILNIQTENLSLEDYLYFLIAEHSALAGPGTGVIDTLFKTGGENTRIAQALHSCIKAADYECKKVGFFEGEKCPELWGGECNTVLEEKFKFWAMQTSQKLLAYIDERERSVSYKFKLLVHGDTYSEPLLINLGYLAHDLVRCRLDIEGIVDGVRLDLELTDLKNRYAKTIKKYVDESAGALMIEDFNCRVDFEQDGFPNKNARFSRHYSGIVERVKAHLEDDSYVDGILMQLEKDRLSYGRKAIDSNIAEALMLLWMNEFSISEDPHSNLMEMMKDSITWALNEIIVADVKERAENEKIVRQTL